MPVSYGVRMGMVVRMGMGVGSEDGPVARGAGRGRDDAERDRWGDGG